MKGIVASAFYGLVLVAMVAGLSHVVERRASAAAGACCAVSLHCPGQQLRYLPNTNIPDCCTGPNCVGPNYCEDRRAD